MIIHGSDINEAALSDVKSLADLKKLQIFSHLPNEDQANEDLWKTIRKEPEVIENFPDENEED